ncbi:Arc family DNA-binding protein [Paraburkholderia dipogonis]|uniref:Arc family DNA-binding protein n=1 Tax=Paraburkholderia dipogonis TaxID=1211383 RepID=UPI0038BC8A65
MARSDPQVNIRMPAELKERLESARIETKRSLNSEIVERLERSLASDDEPFDLNSLLSPGAIDSLENFAIVRNFGSLQEALENAVLAGTTMGAPQVISLTISNDTKMSTVSAVLEAANRIVHPDTTVMLDNTRPLAKKRKVSRGTKTAEGDREAGAGPRFVGNLENHDDKES